LFRSVYLCRSEGAGSVYWLHWIYETAVTHHESLALERVLVVVLAGVHYEARVLHLRMLRVHCIWIHGWHWWIELLHVSHLLHLELHVGHVGIHVWVGCHVWVLSHVGI